jgi:hypothetical protein
MNEYYEMQIDVASQTTVVVWNPTVTGHPMADFDRLILMSDKALEVELTIGEGEATEELISFRLTPNIPFILGADDAYRNHSASDVFAGTLDVIEKIRVKEINQVAAKLTVIMGS